MQQSEVASTVTSVDMFCDVPNDGLLPTIRKLLRHISDLEVPGSRFWRAWVTPGQPQSTVAHKQVKHHSPDGVIR